MRTCSTLASRRPDIAAVGGARQELVGVWGIEAQVEKTEGAL